MGFLPDFEGGEEASVAFPGAMPVGHPHLAGNAFPASHAVVRMQGRFGILHSETRIRQFIQSVSHFKPHRSLRTVSMVTPGSAKKGRFPGNSENIHS
jgi:hypothetical protein